MISAITQNDNMIYNLLLADNVAHAVADASKDGVLLVNPEHKIAFVNKTLKEWLLWLGLETHEWIGCPDGIVYTQIRQIVKNSHTFGLLLSSVSGTQNLISESIDIEFNNDVYKYIQLYTSPIYSQADGYLGRLWIFENKTKEQQVNQMKTEFISIASHQLRTPLSAVKGYLSMLVNGDAGNLENDAKEFANAALEGANRLADLVDDLLNVSRLEMGKTVARKELKDVKAVIERIIAIYEPKMREKKIKLNQMLEVDDEKFKLDESILTNALGNIIDNGIKYNKEEGELNIKVRIIKDDPEHRKLRIEVSDSGVGIPKQQQERIFEKFFRADNVRNNEFSGTGIGLYYVFKLINALRGKIWFESEENKGTTFFIDIPE